MTNRDQILARIAHLMKLADGNANEHEAAAAMRAAAKLMAEHEIDAATIAEHDPDSELPVEPIDRHEIEQSGKSQPTWQWVLLSELARCHGCVAYRDRRAATLDHPAGLVWMVAGTALDASAVRYLYAYAARQIEGLAKKALDNGMGSGRTWANNFRLGCAERVGQRYREASVSETKLARANAVEQGNSTALVRVDERAEAKAIALRTFVKEKLRLRAGSSSGSRGDVGARQAGRSAGDRVDLGRGRSAGSLGGG